MKQIKQIIVKFDDGSVKGYNLNAFVVRFKYGLKSWLGQV